MGFHDFEPKPGWNSVVDNIVEDFYKPAFKYCERYDRLSGYFDSSSFAVAIREVLDFVERGGRMRLGTGVQLLPADINVMKKSVERKLNEKTAEMLEDDLGKKCLAVLAQMLSTEIDGSPQLEIKFFVPKNGGIYHPKTGVFTMPNGDIVSFSGSVNETGAGWTRNVEEFKAYCSWVDGKFVDIDKMTFQEFWNNEHPSLYTYDLPTAVRKNIFKVKAGSEEEYRTLLGELKQLMYSTSNSRSSNQPKEFGLYDYQEKAIESWSSHEYRGILEMPTAVGKTFTALGCINRLQCDRGRLFTVVTVPYNHLVQQWIDNIKRWNKMVPHDMQISSRLYNIAKSTKWRSELRSAVGEFNRTNVSGKHLISGCIVCTTYNKFATNEFIDAIRKVDGETLLVADEAHNVGSKGRSKGLVDTYTSRLALTATPDRYFDEEGSKLIRSYFNDVVFFMEIGEAIRKNYLTPYDYYPVFVELNADEIKKYRELTRRIAQMRRRDDKNKDLEDYQMGPANKRSRLIARAEQKYAKFSDILKMHGNELEHALVYCLDNKQLDRVGRILSKKPIFYEKITKATKMIERRDTIRSLEDKKHGCIVSMNCLDEGVDIPSAQLGIIMASTGNRLQYIQRRGRFLRRFEGKDRAIIYDILVATPPEEDEEPFAKKLVAKELLRHKEFAKYARNKEEALDAIRPVVERLGIDLDRLDMDYILDL